MALLITGTEEEITRTRKISEREIPDHIHLVDEANFIIEVKFEKCKRWLFYYIKRITQKIY